MAILLLINMELLIITMSIELLRQLSGWYLLLMIVLIVYLAILFIVHFFVPKALLRAYFREPYFSAAEIVYFTGPPYAYIRTAMFMRLAGWPSSGRKRGITGIDEIVPPWFRLISKFMIYALLCLTFFLLVMTAVMYFGLCVFHDQC